MCLGTIYGIGTDITECVRIAQMIDKHGELFLTRVYTQQEIAYCSAAKPPRNITLVVGLRRKQR